MPTLLLVLIAVLLLPCCSAPALAEDFPDIGKVNGILLYEGFQHGVNFAYDFTQNKTAQNSTFNSNAFRESYNATLLAALVDPRIFDVSLQGTVDFNQNWSRGSDTSSSSSRATSYQYNFSGNGLSKSRVPFTLLNYRTVNTTQNTFSPPTTADNTGNEFSINYLNDRLQSNFHYSRVSTGTAVAGVSSSSTSNAYSYGAVHKYGAFSTTSLVTTFSDQTGSSSSGDKLTTSNNSLSLINSLTFGTTPKYSLQSSFQINNTATDNFFSRVLNFSEAFDAVLGRALSLNASYSLTNNHSNDQQDKTTNKGDVRLSHKLFESLQTDLSGTATFNKVNDGYENNYSVRGNASYQKKIAAGNHLSLGVNKAYNLVDRNFSTGITTVRDERHAGVKRGDVIKLTLADGSLRRVSAVTSRNPIFTYVEGVDYTVNYTLGFITILSGGDVRIDIDGTGTELYITYTLYQDPQIKFSNDLLSLTSNLGLFNSAIFLGASWSETTYTLINGPKTNSLQDSNSQGLYISASYDTISGRVSYTKSKTGELKYHTYEGNLVSNWQTANGAISLITRDTYNLYDSRSTSAAYWDNNADMTISYQRNILTNTSLSIVGNANDSRSSTQTAKDSLSFHAQCQIQMNSVSINLSGQTTWVIDQNGTSRIDSIHIDLSRYF